MYLSNFLALWLRWGARVWPGRGNSRGAGGGSERSGCFTHLSSLLWSYVSTSIYIPPGLNIHWEVPTPWFQHPCSYFLPCSFRISYDHVLPCCWIQNGLSSPAHASPNSLFIKICSCEPFK